MKHQKYIHLGLSILLTSILFQQQAQAQATPQCQAQYTAAIEAAEQDWQDNLQNLIDQQKPASEMVDEAYENLRTYNCWLEYICRSVQYSGHAPMGSVLSTGGLTSKHLGKAPGCQKPENVELNEHYSSFVEKLNADPQGSSTVDVDMVYQNQKINYFPGCMTDPLHDNKNPLINQLSDNYAACKKIVDGKFGCDPTSGNYQDCIQGEESAQTSVTWMETALKKSHADQEATALETKLGGIITRMHGMREQVAYLANFLSQLDQRLACVIKQCT